MIRPVAVAGIWTMLSVPGLGAQIGFPLRNQSSTELPSPRLVQPEGLSVPDWLTPIASALAPGSGQIMNGRDRGVLYIAGEAFFLMRLLSLQSEGRRERDRFRQLAFTVARAPFRPARQDTVFEYFEAMEQYVESGVFDTDAGEVLVPPTDEATFNGRIWTLARETFFADPDIVLDTASEEYRRALEFYRSRAVGPNFQWSWRNAGLEQDLFRQSIRRSDDAFRLARQYLGLILANHLLSLIDEFVSYRLGRQSRGGVRSALLTGRGQGGRMVTQLVVQVGF